MPSPEKAAWRAKGPLWFNPSADGKGPWANVHPVVGRPSRVIQSTGFMSSDAADFVQGITDKLRAHYSKTFEAHGPCAKGVDWRDGETAELRYRKMAQVLAFAPDAPGEQIPSVLDVGCGYGAQYDYFAKAGVAVDYEGIDVVPEMIVRARTLHPAARFEARDLFSLASAERYDFVLCNGIFTQKLDTDRAEMAQFMDIAVTRMFAHCRRGIAFNVMSTKVNYFAPNLFYRSPLETIVMCFALTPYVALDHGYGLYEYTTYCFKCPAET